MGWQRASGYNFRALVEADICSDFNPIRNVVGEGRIVSNRGPDEIFPLIIMGLGAVVALVIWGAYQLGVEWRIFVTAAVLTAIGVGIVVVTLARTQLRALPFGILGGSCRVPGCWETEERLVALTDL